MPNTVFSAVTYYLKKKAEEWKKRDKMIYIVKEVVFTNTVKSRLLTSMRIHLVMNVS